MKILDAKPVPEKAAPPWPYDGSPLVCPHCQSKIAFEEHDIKSQTVTAVTNRTTGITVASFTCPVCTEAVHVRHQPEYYASVTATAREHGFIQH